MSEQTWWGIGCLSLGIFTLVSWWVEMFSDSPMADMWREYTERDSLGRNTTSIFLPSVGGMMSSGGLAIILGGDPENPLCMTLIVFIWVFMIMAAVGFLPIRWPAPWYPEYQKEKRRKRAEQERLARQLREAEGAESRPEVSQPSQPSDAEPASTVRPSSDIPPDPQPYSFGRFG